MLSKHPAFVCVYVCVLSTPAAGILNIFDLVRLSDAIIADGVVFNECELLSGDVTGDDILNILDVTTAVAIIISGP